MRPVYQISEAGFEIYLRKISHFSPHLHNSLEIIYVLSGSFELGMMQEFYHMDRGDVALIFPGVVHHTQVFDPTQDGTMIVLRAATVYCGSFYEKMHNFIPENPVIPASVVHPDVVYAMHSLLADEKEAHPDRMVPLPATTSDDVTVHTGLDEILAPASDMATDSAIVQAFIQIILSRSMPQMTLRPRPSREDGDLVYRCVEYIAAHFREPLTLTGVARDLYVSPYTLSRLFSGLFHTNFNGYVNNTRTQYACSLLLYTARPITDIWMESGFESQRTFNRVFQDIMRMSPREYRSRNRKKEDNKEASAQESAT